MGNVINEWIFFYYIIGELFGSTGPYLTISPFTPETIKSFKQLHKAFLHVFRKYEH